MCKREAEYNRTREGIKGKEEKGDFVRKKQILMLQRRVKRKLYQVGVFPFPFFFIFSYSQSSSISLPIPSSPFPSRFLPSVLCFPLIHLNTFPSSIVTQSVPISFCPSTYYHIPFLIYLSSFLLPFLVSSLLPSFHPSISLSFLSLT